jgi:hypothetical protein
MAVVDKQTGKPSIPFYVGRVQWKTEDSVEIKGGYHSDGPCAAGVTFSVKLRNGKWTIVSEEMNWIS